MIAKFQEDEQVSGFDPQTLTFAYIQRMTL